ncbi:hypothetical protein [Lactobacillus sp. Sy-1]|uniref:hypothetical protein n=1 Tax=Lactobacillus sp. Sy-1 TaxID=2109645 RepID=UPI001C5A8E2F|nr:hypothetical protein [Lactobacillus sp. Sy-1]MBW1606164.1 hypothetical protein [Lactobacillus sp. Sy-1]
MKITENVFINPLENVRSYGISELKQAGFKNRLFQVAHLAAIRAVDLSEYYSPSELEEMAPKDKAAKQTEIANHFFDNDSVTLNEVERNSTLTHYLRDWYGHDLGMNEQESAVNMAKHVHGFFDNGDYWYYLSRVKLSSEQFDTDLLDGTGDGSAVDYFTTYFTKGDKYMNEATEDGRDEKWVRNVFTQRIKNATSSLGNERLTTLAYQFKDDDDVYNAIRSNQD